MKPYRVIIAGSRECPESSPKLFNKINKLLYPKLTPENTEIVSGTCRGADKLGENFAKIYGYDLVYFPADWNVHGKVAGPIRNKQMAEYSTHLILLTDGISKGSQDMLKQANKHSLEIRKIKI